MFSQNEYDAALRQLKTSPADVTDHQLAVFRDRNPGFAARVEASRAMHRRGAEYQARLDAEQREANYQRDCDRRRRQLTIAQREAGYRGLDLVRFR
jgi:hypothetical protein